MAPSPGPKDQQAEEEVAQVAATDRYLGQNQAARACKREGHHAPDRKPSRVTIACPPADPTTAITVITAVPSPDSSAV